jgi:hypothetical protein
MATSSQVKAALDAVAEAIAKNRERMVGVKATATEVSVALGELPTLYADVVTTVNGYGTTNAFEALAKAELAKLATEYTALKDDADTIAAVNLSD